MSYLYSRQIPIQETVDVIVVGAGSAGAVAAIAAGRAGARTLLLERLPFSGGASTAVLDTFYGFYTPGGIAKKVVGGIPDDVVAGLKRFNAWLERPNTHGAGTAVTYHPDYLKIVWENLLCQSGVRVLLNAWVQDVVREENRISSVVVASKLGLLQFSAKVFIDASGDADLCHFANMRYELAGEAQPAQTLTTTFRMCNVDIARRKAVSKAEFHSMMATAASSGDYALTRTEGSDHITPVSHMTATIMTRLPSYARNDMGVVNATDPVLLSAAETQGRQQALEYIRFLRERVPGYAHAQLACFGTQIGVRETRRVYGDYRLSREDVLAARQFEDQIGLCGAPIEDHCDGVDTKWAYLPEGQCVGIPYRTLLPKDGENILVAGRCFSATHEAHASVRSMGQTMSMGQAAGIAAAMAAASGKTPRQISIPQLQDAVRKLGGIVTMDDITGTDAITR